MYLSVLGLISKGLLCFPNQKAQRFGGSWGHIKTISIWFIGWWNLASWQMLDLQPWCWAKDIHLCALFWEILTVQKLALFFFSSFSSREGKLISFLVPVSDFRHVFRKEKLTCSNLPNFILLWIFWKACIYWDKTALGNIPVWEQERLFALKIIFHLYG